MLKSFKFLIMAFILCIAGGFCYAQDMKKKNVARVQLRGDYMDFDIYRPENVQGKGALYIDKAKLSDKQLNISVFDKKGDIEGIWRVGGDLPSVYIKNAENAAADDGDSAKTRHEEEVQITVKDVFNAIDQDKYFLISAIVSSATAAGFKTVPLRVSKEEMSAYGFLYIPLADVIEICRKNLDMAKSVVGAEIKLSESELKKVHEKEKKPYAVNSPGEEIVSLNPSGQEPPKRKIYMLRRKPSLSAPFIDIEEPRINLVRTLFKKDYWYELEVTVNMPFDMAPGEFAKIYQGKTYRGFWQAQYDENGFPLLLTEMVKGKWSEIARQYLDEKQKEIYI